MPLALHKIMPSPGPVWGYYPQRPAADAGTTYRQWEWRSGTAVCGQTAIDAASFATLNLGHGSNLQTNAIDTLRTGLRRDGLCPQRVAQGLGLVAECARKTLHLDARPTQLYAAAVLLDNRMAEMATGEGKTLTIAMAAAVAAMAGIPVHVVTANAYLARRDAGSLAQFFNALGIRVGVLEEQMPDDLKREVYSLDVVYATAKGLAFDHLRDWYAAGARKDLSQVAEALSGKPLRPPLMRGLCMALLDEADSILLDEAELPLILSQSAPHAGRRAFLWQALAIARQLRVGQDFTVNHADHSVGLREPGHARLAAMAQGLAGPWQRPRYRREAVLVALAGLHIYHRNEHYVVRDGAIDLLDGVTGRAVPGRVWSRGLHTIVALKEGLPPPDESVTVAQTTFQRFFQRYWRLCGISGTLREAESELQRVYAMKVVRIPLHQACRREVWPALRFADKASMFKAIASRVAELHGTGRPVLIGVDSVSDSLLVNALLMACGCPHHVLNALNDSEESAIVARAGVAGSVTVATRMAGRGTDIVLDDKARAAGGLHVLCCQNNSSRRQDRQLIGRASRHGDPGSVEMWGVDDSDGAQKMQFLRVPGSQFAQARKATVLDEFGKTWRQWSEERRQMHLRQALLEQDLHWEKRLSFAGSSN